MNVISLLTPKAQVAYLYEDFTIRQGLEKLRAHGYTAIPVLARDGCYVGTVSEGDFLWNILDGKDNSLRTQERLPLRQVLRPNFNPAVRIDVTLSQLLERAMQQSFIPVVDDRGAFVGIVTRQNIIRRLTIPNVDDYVPEEAIPAASPVSAGSRLG
ncbi:CBS domain-containing protein [Pseudoflavonifractor sp. AF19-9AC]|uniref:CBS domain-containing protein n=1 Tax=Pseudoflavonifractor sp. AF19-9AC TaxID=2292244 RepID=UPI000E495A32|nr:CBS domain-containing protein [Pseudoflavonifractor sp. AF19-9AC]RHR10279.1 CBS domain-containing protein [Pseudoflavonifractor sp. AF19-9AC]